MKSKLMKKKLNQNKIFDTKHVMFNKFRNKYTESTTLTCREFC